MSDNNNSCEHVIHSCLQNLDVTPQTITGCRDKFCQFYSSAPAIAARTWRNVVRSSETDQLLALMYVANEVLQYTSMNPKRFGNNYLEAFWPYLTEGFGTAYEKGDSRRVERIISILGERDIYSKKSCGILMDGVKSWGNKNSNSRGGDGKGSSLVDSDSDGGDGHLIKKSSPDGGSPTSMKVALSIPEVRKRKVTESKTVDEAFNIDNIIGVKKAKLEEKGWPEREAELQQKVKEFTRRFREVQKIEGFGEGSGKDMTLLGSEALVEERASALKEAKTVDKMLAVLEECLALSGWIYKKQKETLQGVKGERERDEEEIEVVEGMIDVLTKTEGMWEKSREERKKAMEREEEARIHREQTRLRKEEAEKTVKQLERIKEKANDT
eukprot:CAMPEP_0118634460 /NCGR_PEP_ID=MMETSP0785-20121206/1556_1 /TAXON_ID=91992 /ORGANISM="Bolidomonas pacifica, Strain CCMP 1866" /LENGTH=383 /DNA_ID=CAMNT_0006525431 /DNA_START=173 /DNA_END=1321 /DNA_ORIENTATION=-